MLKFSKIIQHREKGGPFWRISTIAQPDKTLLFSPANIRTLESIPSLYFVPSFSPARTNHTFNCINRISKQFYIICSKHIYLSTSHPFLSHCFKSNLWINLISFHSSQCLILTHYLFYCPAFQLTKYSPGSLGLSVLH